ncbi:MAG: TadE/TadG family type IV pilus assembly protein [Xanthobacteraceae bacterium]
MFEVVKDCAGAAFLEFALVLPVLLLVMFGITTFGEIFYHYTLVTNAAAAGTRQLSVSWQDSNAYCDTENTIINASGGLGGTPGSTGSCPTISSDFTITIAVQPPTMSTPPTCVATPVTCTSNSTCQSALAAAHNAGATPACLAKVTVQFSCSAEDLIAILGFPIHLGVCPVKSTIQASVQ